MTIKDKQVQRGQTSKTFIDLWTCREFQIPCFCQAKPYQLNCEVCSDKKVLEVSKVTDIMSKGIRQKKFLGDAVWTKNAATHLIWKLSAYGKALLDNEMKFLTATNLVHHLLKCYNREFDEG